MINIIHRGAFTKELAHLIQQLGAYCAEIEMGMQQHEPSISLYPNELEKNKTELNAKIPTINHDMVNTFLKKYYGGNSHNEDNYQSELNISSSTLLQDKEHTETQEMSNTWHNLLHGPSNNENQIIDYIFGYILEVGVNRKLCILLY